MRFCNAAFVFQCLLASLNGLSVPSSESSKASNLGKSRPSLHLFARKSVLKKWNWKQASEESRTEWGIVLKRYILVDMALYELGRHIEEALPSKPTSEDSQDVVNVDALGTARVKLERVQSNLQKALVNQNTSDTTSKDMQKNRKGNELTVHEKRVLRDEHKKEQDVFFAVEASGQDVVQQASAVIEALDEFSKRKQPSWSSIVPALVPKSDYASLLPKALVQRNRTAIKMVLPKAKPGSNSSSVPEASSSIQTFFQKFQDAARNYHRDLGNFEGMQKQAITNFLALTNLLALDVES